MITDELKNLRSFNEKALTLGIPSKLFGGSIAISLIFMVMMNFILGLILLFLLLIPLYIIHKDDPEASSLYISEYLSSDRYSLDIDNKTELKIVNIDGSIVSFESFSLQRKNTTSNIKDI
ncbi:hypothetical protein [Pseudoalteromonas nigrifaciens]|uniref:hypothetical protein n=1 Tax=Pseudoalteromonas nigrifaciens TaxID=28109 RepID=UPI003FD2BACF